MSYVDGFVLPVPQDKLEEYRALAQKAGQVWLEHGALHYVECAGDDLNIEHGVPFPRLASVQEGETVVFAWIFYQSKEHRDEINAKVMADERLAPKEGEEMPFDLTRMTYGGFRPIVEYGGRQA